MRGLTGLVAAVVISLLTSTGLAAPSIGTDGTWQITRNNGASFFAPDSFSARTLPDGSSATGIFGGNPSNIADTWYAKTFTLSDPTLSAVAHFSGNDIFELLVNGNSVDLSGATTVGSGGDTYRLSPVAGLSISSSFFVVGTNDVLFKTHVSGDKFLAARLDVNVPEPASTVLLGIAGPALLLRRRRNAASRSARL